MYHFQYTSLSSLGTGHRHGLESRGPGPSPQDFQGNPTPRVVPRDLWTLSLFVTGSLHDPGPHDPVEVGVSFVSRFQVSPSVQTSLPWGVWENPVKVRWFRFFG